MYNCKKFFCRLILLFAIPGFILLIFSSQVLAVDKTIFIAETMANPEGTDGKENEYIILKNQTADEKNLSGYKLCNIKNYCYTLNLKLAAGACGKILRSSFLFTLYNDEEKISLFDSTSNLVDEVYFKNALSGKPWVCDSNNCDFSLPVSNCDYSSIFEVETDQGLESETTEADIYVKNPDEQKSDIENLNSNSSGGSSNSNTKVVNSNQNSYFPIKNKADFKKAGKIINKSKESLLVSLSAQAVIPKNVLGKNTFYLMSEGEWLSGQAYASFCKINNCDDLDVLLTQRSLLKIEGAYLGFDGQNFSLNLGKKSHVFRQEAKEESSVKLENIKNTDELRKKAGKKIEIAGEILLKKGSYFYVKTEKGVATLYVPAQILTEWLAERKSLLKSLFPVYEEEKNWPGLVYKGAKIRAEGVIEARKSSYRIVIDSFKNLNFEWPTKITSAVSKNKINDIPAKSYLSNSNNNESRKVIENPSMPVEKGESSEQKRNIEKLNDFLADKMPWLDLLKIFSLKIWAKL